MPRPDSSITSAKGKSSWTSTAFMVEVLVLLFFLVASMAVFTQLFASSITTSNKASRLSQATVIAQNAAEEFSADPVAAKKQQADTSDGLDVTRKITSSKAKNGTRYKAHITVLDEGDVVYELDATRYVEGGTK